MSECYNCERLQNKYDNLSWKYDKLSDKYYELEKKYNNTYNELSSAEFKIRTELEPRIKSEHRSYDAYVTSGGSDECFSNGMNGHCGFECSMFGDKAECFEGIKTEEEVLNIYENYVTTGHILNLIEEYGLEEKVKEIDREAIRQQIDVHKAKIEKLEKELLAI
jgi:hypothetical protein